MMRTVLLFLTLINFNYSFAKVSAIYNKNIVEISWKNPKNIMIKSFCVERSKHGRYFEEIIQIDVEPEKYKINEFYEIDNKPFKKKGYYRIKQIDVNDKIYYSEAVFAKNNTISNSIFDLFFKNDKYNNLKNYSEKDVLVVLIDKDRKEFIAKVDIESEDKTLIIVSSNVNLPTGKYLVKATSDDLIYGKNIYFKGSYFIPLQTHNTK